MFNETKIARASKIIRHAIHKANPGSLMLLATDFCESMFRQYGEVGCALCKGRPACDVYTRVQGMIMPLIAKGQKVKLNPSDLVIPQISKSKPNNNEEAL